MRIAFGGISIEATNFSPVPSTLDDFIIYRGEALVASDRYPFLKELKAEFVPTLFAQAWPGGAVDAHTYQILKGELLARLTAIGPVDGFYLDLHGAMKVDGMDDAEADLAADIRAIVGSRARIAASMDLHGNVSQTYVASIDLLTAYRTAPHRDALETRHKACRMLVDAIANATETQIACVPIPVLLSGEATRTDMEPGRHLWGALPEIDKIPGVLDASLFVGFAWVDEPRAHAAAVITGTNTAVIQREAQKLAQAYWAARHEFKFGTPVGSIDECIQWALAADEACVFISDSGDNTTAGAVGDIPGCLASLLTHNVPSAVVAGLTDATAVVACVQAGVGATLALRLGGKLDTAHGQPLPVHGKVISLFDGGREQDRQVVFQVANVKVILTERRSAFTQVSDFTQVGIDPLAHKIVVVKLGYLFPDLLRIAPLAYMALTPGAAAQDLARLPYRRIQRPMYPMDSEMAWAAE
ncbi:MAG: M81 family metallopeptidase [Chloroflexi bacterium]|nr:M81 family metallopeptidase [Chloroflexota bacterium]